MNKIVMIIALALVFNVNANAKPYFPNSDLACWKDKTIKNSVICPNGAIW